MKIDVFYLNNDYENIIFNYFDLGFPYLEFEKNVTTV